MIPLLVAYTTGQREAAGWKGFWVGVSFTLGTSVTFTAPGLAAAVLGGLLGFSRSILYYLAAAVSILAGLYLVGLVQVSLPSLGLQSLKHSPHRPGGGLRPRPRAGRGRLPVRHTRPARYPYAGHGPGKAGLLPACSSPTDWVGACL